MQEIFETINQSSSDKDERMDISIFKDALTSLIDQNKIINRGKEGKESYFVVEDINADINMNNIFQTEDGVMEDLEKIELEKIITDKLIHVIDNRINSEVKNELLKLRNESNHFFNNDSLLSMQPNVNDVYQNQLINNLKSEIAFLRKELLSKSEIIKMLIDDKSRRSNINDSVAAANKTSINTSNKNPLSNKIHASVKTTNSFSALSNDDSVNA